MGAHAFSWLVRPPPSSCSRVLLLILCFLASSHVSNSTDADALLKFKSSLTNQEAFNTWIPSYPPCQQANSSSWLGVLCLYGNVWGLQLEKMNLGGDIDVDALSQLPALRTISLKNNKFTGPLPEIYRLHKLRSIYLSNNHFEGEIPDDAFAGMFSLRRVILVNNSFTGKIPSSLTTLPILVEVNIEGNQFQGRIPNFQQKQLSKVNVANNQLEGPIPSHLKDMDPKFMEGNKGLCGPPLEPCIDGQAAGNNHHKSSTKTIIIVLAVLLALVILALIIILLLIKLRKRNSRMQGQDAALASQEGHQVAEETYIPPTKPPAATTTKRSEPGKLDFVREDRKMFDLSDLLTASAEVLESGNFMSLYKVEIFAGQVLVVKRFRQMNKVGREDFHEHIRRMGRLRHPNVLSLVAYYYRKEEKLLIFDFVDNGNLASHLHGNRSEKEAGLDWPTRLKIIKGVARGLAYLYRELPSLTVPHGFLKSANVILNDSYEPLLMDYALLPLINSTQAKQLLVAYKSPEYAQHNRITKKTDVWSLGILILEVLTGKFPTNFLAVGNVKGENLVTWVKEIETEYEKGGDVFDKEMKGTQEEQEEMRKLLKIGFDCCHEDVDVRWSIKDAVQKIEEVTETGSSTSKDFTTLKI